MSEVFGYESLGKRITSLDEKQLEKGSVGGLNWEWNILFDYSSFCGNFEKVVFFKWKFDFDKGKDPQLDGLVGEITASYRIKEQYIPVRFFVKLVHSDQSIWKRIGTVEGTRCPASGNRYFKFRFSLKKICTKSYYVFHHDAYLVVGGEKIAVNKAYLAMHSEFFNKLFNSNFKEKSMSEIPIEDVKLEEFGNLLKMLHPTNPMQATDSDAEKLLKLADRFMIPSVSLIIENHLQNSSELPFFKLLELAEKFKIEHLFNWCASQFTTIDHLRFLNHLPKDYELSVPLQTKLFGRLLEILGN